MSKHNYVALYISRVKKKRDGTESGNLVHAMRAATPAAVSTVI